MAELKDMNGFDGPAADPLSMVGAKDAESLPVSRIALPRQYGKIYYRTNGGDHRDARAVRPVPQINIMQGVTLMLPPHHRAVLREICRRLAGLDLTWALTGSAALALQGMAIEPADLDLQTDTTGAYAIERAFGDRVTRRVSFSTSERIRSHFGALLIHGITVEIMGDVEKLVDGAWEEPPDLACHLRFIDYEGLSVPILNPAYEYLAYLKLGRSDRARMLRDWLAGNVSPLAACGNDCRACPRFAATLGSNQARLRAVAELWHRVGWRDRVVAPEEIACGGCAWSGFCRYGIKSCSGDKGIEHCALCGDYPCLRMEETFTRTAAYAEKCRTLCTEEEYEALKEAFFAKRANLDSYRRRGGV